MVLSQSSSQLQVIPYHSQYRYDFERLNREWIEQFFVLEEPDLVIFADPQTTVIAAGGEIFFVLEHGQAIGTCAMLRLNPTTYELAKMAVTASARGRGIGDLLMVAAIEFAREKGASEIILSSNTSLAAAIHLYKKYGFEVVPYSFDPRYHRVDIKMSLDLRNEG
jgi:putative acetyltransferase